MSEVIPNHPGPDRGLYGAGHVQALIERDMGFRNQQGYDLAGFAERLKASLDDLPALWSLYEDLCRTTIRPDFPYEEPDNLEAILALRPDGPRTLPYDLTNIQLKDKCHGALLGRIIGIILGRPVEGWTEVDIRQRLESTGEYPLSDYFSRYWYKDGVRQDNYWATFRSTREGLRMTGAAEGDDDSNYVMIYLRLLEKYGMQFTTSDVGFQWLESFPVNWSWGPERTAYINLARFTDLGVPWRDIDDAELLRITHHMHQCSELIGAQIRADVFGYASPGLPERAAEWAWRDARLTHVKNGIYGEMLYAAIIAAVFCASTIREAIEIGLTEIPENCRLSEAMRNTLAWWDETQDWRVVYERIAEAYNQYLPGGTINNACIIANALLAGGGDFEKTLTITVMQGQDTDCTAGTAGSIIGAWLGGSSVPEKWSAPLNDTFDTAIAWEGRRRISEVADRVFHLANTYGKVPRKLGFKYDM